MSGINVPNEIDSVFAWFSSHVEESVDFDEESKLILEIQDLMQEAPSDAYKGFLKAPLTPANQGNVYYPDNVSLKLNDRRIATKYPIPLLVYGGLQTYRNEFVNEIPRQTPPISYFFFIELFEQLAQQAGGFLLGNRDNVLNLNPDIRLIAFLIKSPHNQIVSNGNFINVKDDWEEVTFPPGVIPPFSLNSNNFVASGRTLRCTRSSVLGEVLGTHGSLIQEVFTDNPGEEHVLTCGYELITDSNATGGVSSTAAVRIGTLRGGSNLANVSISRNFDSGTTRRLDVSETFTPLTSSFFVEIRATIPIDGQSPLVFISVIANFFYVNVEDTSKQRKFTPCMESRDEAFGKIVHELDIELETERKYFLGLNFDGANSKMFFWDFSKIEETQEFDFVGDLVESGEFVLSSPQTTPFSLLSDSGGNLTIQARLGSLIQTDAVPPDEDIEKLLSWARMVWGYSLDAPRSFEVSGSSAKISVNCVVTNGTGIVYAAVRTSGPYGPDDSQVIKSGLGSVWHDDQPTFFGTMIFDVSGLSTGTYYYGFVEERSGQFSFIQSGVV